MTFKHNVKQNSAKICKLEYVSSIVHILLCTSSIIIYVLMMNECLLGAEHL